MKTDNYGYVHQVVASPREIAPVNAPEFDILELYLWLEGETIQINGRSYIFPHGIGYFKNMINKFKIDLKNYDKRIVGRYYD